MTEAAPTVSDVESRIASGFGTGVKKGLQTVVIKTGYNGCGQYQPDSRWSWIVCIACAVSNIFICGVTYSYGILFPVLLDEFKQGKGKTALVGSLAMVGLGVSGTLVAKVFNRFGPRVTTVLGTLVCSGALFVTAQMPSLNWILLTYGVVFGLGASFVFLPLYLVIPRYFVKRRSLALGLVAMGPGGGLFVMSPILQVLIESFDWRGALMVAAGIILLIIPLVCTIRNTPDETPEVGSYQSEKTSRFPIFGNKRFLVYSLSFFLFYIGDYIPSVHMVRYCEDLGISASEASKLYLYSGLMSLTIRPLIGRLCDVKWIDACYVYQVAAGLHGVATLVLPLARSYYHFVLYFIVFGFTEGTTGSASSIAAMSCFPRKHRSVGFGAFMTLSVTTSACGPALGGVVADIYGSYHPAFYMTGLTLVLSAFVIFCVPFMKKTKQIEETVCPSEVLVTVEKCTVV